MKNKILIAVTTMAILLPSFALAQVSDKTCEKKGALIYPNYRQKIEKPHYNCVPRDAYILNKIVIKFREGTKVRLRDGKLVSISTPTNTAEWEGLDRVKSILTQYDVLDKIERHFTDKNKSKNKTDEEIEKELDKESKEDGWRNRAGDYNLWYVIDNLDHLTEVERVELVNALNELDIIEWANFRGKVYLGFEPPPIPSSELLHSRDTPTLTATTCPEGSYEDKQYYLEPAPIGIDAKYAWTQPGGTGSGITVFDIGYDWNFLCYTKALKMEVN